MSTKGQKIHFEVNRRKALEAVLYVLNKREQVNVYNVLKVMFDADKYHLNQYGRPVTGDVYIRMPHGTVPSAIYDMIKGDILALSVLDLSEFPFKQVGGHDLKATRQADLDLLSESDIEALDHACERYLDLDFTEVRRKNHQEKCWLDGDENTRIDFESMIENDEVLEYLKQCAPLNPVV